MKLKIEFTNGSIEVIKIDVVSLRLEENKLIFAYDNFEEINDFPLETISRVTIAGEIIYDYIGRKQSYDGKDILEKDYKGKKVIKKEKE